MIIYMSAETEQKLSCSPAGNLKTLTSEEYRVCAFNQRLDW